jgi:hypothetical protein
VTELTEMVQVIYPSIDQYAAASLEYSLCAANDWILLRIFPPAGQWQAQRGRLHVHAEERKKAAEQGKAYKELQEELAGARKQAAQAQAVAAQVGALQAVVVSHICHASGSVTLV